MACTSEVNARYWDEHVWLLLNSYIPDNQSHKLDPAWTGFQVGPASDVGRWTCIIITAVVVLLSSSSLLTNIFCCFVFKMCYCSSSPSLVSSLTVSLWCNNGTNNNNLRPTLWHDEAWSTPVCRRWTRYCSEFDESLPYLLELLKWRRTGK